MPKLLVLQGLPGSGKTTIAGDLQHTGWVRVNKDAIRESLTANGWKWSPKNEHDVLEVRDAQIAVNLLSGRYVVSDDTNFGKHPETLKKLAEKCQAEFELRYIHTPLEECIRRDSLRKGKAKVGEEVIRNMSAKYLTPPFKGT